ncbi:hypothetical protein [Zavarzinella formosa]|uniref:hypothetical protein n=1 Tax=Zavarzinella formosa TaxID=360055 RepID=UPI0003030834|nr:hypothetical protein [Zavarzinella formosa]
MRNMAVLLVGLAVSIPALAADDRAIDKNLDLILRDVHDRGATLHNGGDPAGCYRMYQGGLLVARQMIGHRPELQKTITTGLQTAEREVAVANRAIALHQLIEKVRGELAKPVKVAGPEQINIPPREIKPEPKPTAKVVEINDGIIGRVIWQGQPLEEVEVSFVTLGLRVPRIYDTKSGKQGVYSHQSLPPGTYLVILTSGPACPVKKLPERYSTTGTTPLRVEIKGHGEKFDFILQ